MRFPAILEEMRQKFESGLRQHFSECNGPRELIDAMGYSLFAGGKRIRPILLLASNRIFAEHGFKNNPMPAACALEYIHTYSLIHDDLPAMDNDDLRRGMPTCHVKFGEAMAILSGDALLTEAFGLLSRSYLQEKDFDGCRVVAEVALAAGASGMVGGQVLDISATGKESSRENLEQIHRLKTGALIKAAIRCGAIIGGAGSGELEALSKYAEKTGLAFQVMDDVLDAMSQTASLGKTAGKDKAQGKTTYIDLMGAQGATEYGRSLIESAKSDLKMFGEKAMPLRELADYIISRNK